jgi:polar amino acid transport system substrate-binding protein
MHPTRRAVLVAPLLAALTRGAAHAQAVSAIRDRGRLNVGVLKDFAPFGGLNKDGDPVGFEVDVATLIGHHLSVRVGFVLLTAAERIAALSDGRVDLVAGQFGVTTERATSVAFATPHLLTDGGLFAPEKRKIDKPDDMTGLKIGVVRGSPADFFLTTSLAQKAELLRFETDGETFAALTANKVDAISQAPQGVAAYVADHPDADMAQKLVLFSAANAMAVRPDAEALRQWLSTFVLFTRQTGELNAIWERWLGRKLPAEMPVL